MTSAVQHLLNSFDGLPQAEKHQAVVEILRRFDSANEGDLPEDVLIEAADDLFRALDSEEASHAPR